MTSSFNNGSSSSAYYEATPGVSATKENKRAETFDGGGYGIFWDEYHSIEQSSTPHNNTATSSSLTTTSLSNVTIVPDSEDGLVSRDGMCVTYFSFSLLLY